MRFELILSPDFTARGRTIPINYQYELSAWIYKVINEGDPVFAEWLHENGYKTDKKPFKLFTFSNLLIPDLRVNKDRLEILADEIRLIISFLAEDAINPFIIGLFKERHLFLGDRQSQMEFDVKQISALPEIQFKNEMFFETLSPVYADIFNPESRYKLYISPDHPKYSEVIHNNLLEKYRVFYKKEPDPNWPNTIITPISEPKAKLITIKSGTEHTSKIKAYNFRFKIESQAELIRTGYYGGFGRLGSQGFGCVRIF
jgi:CRISPR-associated endoribonuclease Cas6